MRELFENGDGHQPADPHESARKGARPKLRRRFYSAVAVAESVDEFSITLDGKPVRTPAKRALASPRRAIAAALAAEWEAQTELIDPARMQLTRLVNSIIDGVADRTDDVATDVAQYLQSDLLFYRAAGPDGLVARQSEAWDPVVRWAADDLGARFVLAEGIVYVRQPVHALAAARQAIPADPWLAGALHSVTTLTGSALLALALLRGFRDAASVWRIAHVDEDWNFSQWGNDDLAIARRAGRETELMAADSILRAMR